MGCLKTNFHGLFCQSARQLLAVLDWLTMLVRINDDLVEPLAGCQLGLADLGDPERDAGDHHVLRSLHENYLNFLSGKDEGGDEERRV